MKKLFWFTHANIAFKINQNLVFDLTDYISIFVEKKLWDKRKYRTEYTSQFSKADLEKIKSLKINFHSENPPYSNLHNYENVIGEYLDFKKIELLKLRSSGIEEAKKIAVVEVDFESKNKLINNLPYKQEKKIELVLNHIAESDTAWCELEKIKSILCEFMQFFFFNLHLNFLTYDYSFSFSDKPNLTGFTIVSEDDNYFYETNKMDLLSHYLLYVPEYDKMKGLMKETSKFWCSDNPSIYFFLDALKGNYITPTNFLKLVFTVESFFCGNISNDFMTLSIPLLISNSKKEMLDNRELLRRCFNLRNDIVHGKDIPKIERSYHSQKTIVNKEKKMEQVFFELKNLIIKIFYFYINKELYTGKFSNKINHEMIFELFLKGKA